MPKHEWWRPDDEDEEVEEPTLSQEEMQEMYSACSRFEHDMEDYVESGGEYSEPMEVLLTPTEYQTIIELDQQCSVGGGQFFDSNRWWEGLRRILGEKVVMDIFDDKPEVVRLIVVGDFVGIRVKGKPHADSQ
jgi:hypothetical protein